nr:MAG TPA_asm: hypothetical protein [Caudoviricetes sp.]
MQDRLKAKRTSLTVEPRICYNILVNKVDWRAMF